MERESKLVSNPINCYGLSGWISESFQVPMKSWEVRFIGETLPNFRQDPVT